MLVMTPSVCTDLWQIWRIIGWVLLVFKIVIPIIIILFGVMDLGKAVVASKDDEIKKSVKSLAMRAIAGVAIFFIPTLVGAVFKLVDNFSQIKGEYNVCSACLTSPGKCEKTAQDYCEDADGLNGTFDKETGCNPKVATTTE